MHSMSATSVRRSARLAAKASALQKAAPASPVLRKKQEVPTAPKKAARSYQSCADKMLAETQAYRDRLNEERIDILIAVLMERATRFCPRGTPTIDHIQWYSYIVGPLLSAVAKPYADFSKVDHEALYKCMSFWAEDARDLFIFKTMTPEFHYNWSQCRNLLDNIGFHY